MSEQAPKATPEQAEKPDFSTYESTANHFIDSYAGSFTDDAERAAFHAEVVEAMQSIEAEDFDERVKAYEEIIAGLKERANMKAQKDGEPLPFEAPKPVKQETDTEPTESDEHDNDSDEISEDNQTQERQRLNLLQRANLWTGSKVLGMYAAIAARRGANADKYNQRPDESDEEYSKRVRKTGLRYNLAFTAITTGFLAWSAHRGFAHGMDFNPFNDNDAVQGGGNADKGASAGAGDFRDAEERSKQNLRNEWDTNGNGRFEESEILARRDSIIRAETEWFEHNGHHGNDFNSFEPKFDANGKLTNLDEFHEKLAQQYEQSPRMLTSQLHQMQEHGVDFPAELDMLERRDGETNEQYMNRVSEAFYRDPALQDKAQTYTLDFIKEHGKLNELHDYAAYYVKKDEYGNVKTDIDTYVADQQGDYVMSLYGDEDPTNAGIRLGCMQGAENLPPAPVYQSTGNASYSGQGNGGIQTVSYSHDTGGHGNGGSTGGGHGGGEGGHGGGSNGGGEGGGNDDSKNWNQQINTGMDPAGITERTEDPAVSGNGTDSTSITGQERAGSGQSGVTAGENGDGTGAATVGAGNGRTAETGNNGDAASGADGSQSHESATGQSSTGTTDATGSEAKPNTERVE